MGARTYRALVVVQRSAELRRRVLSLLATPEAYRDRRLCDPVRDAVRSPPRNIAEGFGRYSPAEFAQFLDVAIASLDEPPCIAPVLRTLRALNPACLELSSSHAQLLR
ncbi:MAG: four helix bundle protein [Vicinamibacterales bacterium]